MDVTQMRAMSPDGDSHGGGADMAPSVKSLHNSVLEQEIRMARPLQWNR